MIKLEDYIEDLKRQLTYATDDGFDWEYFKDMLEEAEELYYERFEIAP